LTVPGYGITLHNRGGLFTLDPSSPNVIAPHKRPFNTLSAGFVMANNRPLMTVTLMGGDMQAQGIAQVLVNMVVMGIGLGMTMPVFNLAVQNGFARPSDFDTSTSSEFTPVSPIIGTVNLKSADDATGATLPATDIQSNPGGQPIPQRSNVMITAGFALPGFEGRLRAFRVFKPVADSTKPSGWKFVKDGTRLWPDLDGRAQLAGLARTPSDPAQRNIYTFIPDGFGGGTVVLFNAANVALIGPHLALPSDTDLTAAGLITALRSLPIGAITGSTPALMDAPSLDPPPDADYGRPDGSATFAGALKVCADAPAGAVGQREFHRLVGGRRSGQESHRCVRECDQAHQGCARAHPARYGKYRC